MKAGVNASNRFQGTSLVAATIFFPSARSRQESMTRHNNATTADNDVCVDTCTHAHAHTHVGHTHMEACSRRCPATLLLAPMRATAPRVSVSLYSHLTILPGVTVIRVRTTVLGADPLADLPFPRYSASANGMLPLARLLPRAECRKRKMSSRRRIHKRKRHKMSSPKEKLNRRSSVMRHVMLN